jgi:hypothetical protein
MRNTYVDEGGKKGCYKTFEGTPYHIQRKEKEREKKKMHGLFMMLV